VDHQITTKDDDSKIKEADIIDCVYDLETQDPDDFFALSFLLSHPKVKLRAVTIYPGSKQQVGLIREILRSVNQLDVLVGTNHVDYPKGCVSPFHFTVFPNIKDELPDGTATDILHRTILNYPNVTFITGGPPFNLHDLFTTHTDVILKRWVAQGGFAGANMVPEELQLEKFKGKEVCMSANWSSSAMIKYLLSSPNILRRVVCAKNVCHGVVYDSKFHQHLHNIPQRTKGLDLIYQGMDTYLKRHSKGKMFHDPLAAAVAVDESIGEFVEVDMEANSKKEWKSTPKQGTNTFIAIKINMDKFIATICTVP